MRFIRMEEWLRALSYKILSSPWRTSPFTAFSIAQNIGEVQFGEESATSLHCSQLLSRLSSPDWTSASRSWQIFTCAPLEPCKWAECSCFQSPLNFTPLHNSLHWLLVASSIRFKMLMLFYKDKNGPAPAYLKTLIRPCFWLDFCVEQLKNVHKFESWRTAKRDWESRKVKLAMLSFDCRSCMQKWVVSTFFWVFVHPVKLQFEKMQWLQPSWLVAVG